MNAHARFYMDETAITVRRSLDDAIAVYQNEDTIMREKAIDAIAEGRAAFWTTSSYSSAITADLPYALNAGVEINQAIENAFPAYKAYRRVPALDTIVPLNMKAALALSVAYSAKGIWKDEPELLMRAKRDMRRAA
ncbi:hypothetical protein ABMA46_10110 [Mesorhizobium sp. CN5-321]|uniref:hypothetical protein n=1 Tax=Mesorhizobium hunchu TaxID=3157708 RepID=UPI0032B81020